MGGSAFTAPVALVCALVLDREPRAQGTPRTAVPYEQAIEGPPPITAVPGATTVPEPATIALFGAGCIFLWACRRGPRA